ncbi:hypothetical protein Hsc_4654 [Herbaspirillum seropedicae]|nr:hypothetical protein Hsc_4654 [Herbaspirillum seropedicae]
MDVVHTLVLRHYRPFVLSSGAAAYRRRKRGSAFDTALRAYSVRTVGDGCGHSFMAVRREEHQTQLALLVCAYFPAMLSSALWPRRLCLAHQRHEHCRCAAKDRSY